MPVLYGDSENRARRCGRCTGTGRVYLVLFHHAGPATDHRQPAHATVRIVGSDDGRLIHVLGEHKGRGLGRSVRPPGTVRGVAVGDISGVVRLWANQSGELRHPAERARPSACVGDIDFHSDGTVMGGFSDTPRTSGFWDVAHARLRHRMRWRTRFRFRVAFTAPARILATPTRPLADDGRHVSTLWDPPARAR